MRRSIAALVGVVLVLIAALALAIVPAQAGTWTESPDAGDVPLTAQPTVGSGSLNTIFGTLPTDSDIDMYAINIVDQPNFTAAITPLFVTTNPDIWLFNSSGFGIALNDTVSGGQAGINGTLVPSNGLYYLAVTSDGADAFSAGGTIWNSPYVYNQRAPDGPGAAQPFTEWGGTPLNNLINYTVQLNGAEFTQAPEPSSIVLVVVGVLCLLAYAWQRRR